MKELENVWYSRRDQEWNRKQQNPDLRKRHEIRSSVRFYRRDHSVFSKYGYPFEVVNVLDNMQKREALSQMTNWPTLPKVFIGGNFYGDTDILDEMEAKGEVEPLLKTTFGE